MSRLHLLMIVEARRVIEPRTRVTITHKIDMLLTEHSLGRTRHNRDTECPNLIGTGRTLTGRPASGLAGQLAHALVAALGVSVTSLISEII